MMGQPRIATPSQRISSPSTPSEGALRHFCPNPISLSLIYRESSTRLSSSFFFYTFQTINLIMLGLKSALVTLTALLAISTLTQAIEDDPCGIKGDCIFNGKSCRSLCDGVRDVGKELESVCYLDVCFCGFKMTG